jgi:L-alanine-DL-glutamate epimerase-like enolase superfamily enzyme
MRIAEIAVYQLDLPLAAPYRSLIGTWSCQELIAVDRAPGQGARVVDGMMRAPDAPGLGVDIDTDALDAPVARSTARAGTVEPAGSR